MALMTDIMVLPPALFRSIFHRLKSLSERSRNLRWTCSNDCVGAEKIVSTGAHISSQAAADRTGNSPSDKLAISPPRELAQAAAISAPTDVPTRCGRRSSSPKIMDESEPA